MFPLLGKSLLSFVSCLVAPKEEDAGNNGWDSVRSRVT